MKKNLSILACGFLGSAVFTLADWQTFETFEGDLSSWYFSDPNVNCESFEPNFCDGVREIVVDPVLGAGNNVGKFKAANDNVTTNWSAVNAIALPEVVTGPTAFTYYMRFAVADFRMNNVFGLMSKEAETVSNDYGAYESIIGIRTVDSGRIVFRDFDVYVTGSAEAVESLTWYELWLVHDNGDLTYDIYVKGGEEFPDQTLLYEGALFRAGVAEIASFAILIGTGPPATPDGNSDFYIDDLSIDYAGQNLTSPVVGDVGGDKWADYDRLESGDVNTGGFMGWINVVGDPWVWTYNLDKYIYLPEAAVSPTGGWSYIPKN